MEKMDQTKFVKRLADEVDAEMSYTPAMTPPQTA